MKVGVTLFLLCIVGACYAQIVPPGQEKGVFQINYDEWTKDIHWDGAFYVPSTGNTGTPIAHITMTITTISKPDNWQILGYIWDGIETDIVTWKKNNPGQPYPGVPAETWLVADPGQNNLMPATVDGHAYMTGRYSTGCTVIYFDSVKQATGTQHVTTSKYAYVLGGPLVFSVSDQSMSQTHQATPDRDKKGAGARYLQYFGYDTNLLFSPNTLSSYWQRAQTGEVSVQYQQVESLASVDWTLTGPIKIVGKTASEAAASPSIDIGATDGSAVGAATVGATLWVTVDIDGVLLSVQSILDPTEWPNSVDQANGAPVIDSDLYTFTCHKPASMTATGMPTLVEAYPDINQPNTNTGYWAIQDFNVFDTNGDAMPSLWVQERFVPGPFTKWGSAFNEDPHKLYSTNTANWPGFRTNWSEGTLWITSAPAATNVGDPWPGTFGHDNLIIHLDTGAGHLAWPIGSGNPAFYDATHNYFAATYDADKNGTTGIQIGSYHLQMWTDTLVHSKN